MAEVSKLNFGEGVGNRDIKDAKAFRTDDATETALANDDYFPFYDTSVSTKKKSTWSNIVSKIKSTIWKANSSSSEGYVASGANQINKAWRTDANGNPSWKSVPTNRKFIIIGDSFGYGVRGGGQSWASTGWIYYFASLFPNQTIWYDYGQEQAEGVAAFTTTNPTPGTGFETTLLWLKNNKMGNIAPEEITDVVVIGGNNHDVEASYANIVTAVEHFIDTARANFPNANIKIGCFGISAQLQCIRSNAYKGIRQGTLNKGAEFLSDLELLGCQWSWDSGYGHLTEEGYVTCVPYIAQCIISGHTHYCFVEVIPLTVNTSHVSTDAALNFRLCIERTEKYFNIWVNDNNKYYGYYLNNKRSSSGPIYCKAFDPQDSNARIKVPFRDSVFFDHMDVLNRVSGQYLCVAGKGRMYLSIDTNERFAVYCSLEYFFSGVSPSYSNIRFSWEGMGGINQPLDRVLQ